VLAAWSALFLNGLGFLGSSLLPVPGVLAQMIAQGSLVVAIFLAAAANPRLAIRPHPALVLLSVLAVVSLVVSLHNQFFLGSTYRAFRILGFLVALWLLTPWWGRQDRLLLRCHLRVFWVALGTVVAGAVIFPGQAFSTQGRLSGTLWPIPATQVAHLAAAAGGVTALLWMCGVITTRKAAPLVALAAAILVATHTRTALAGVTVGMTVAIVSLFLGNARVRRTTVAAVLVGGTLVALFAGQIASWLARGQTADEASQLTGRTKVWDAVFATPRTTSQQIFGSGLSNQSYNGLPIDSTWVSAYVDQGWLGALTYATVILLILVITLMMPRGPDRAISLFLVTYLVVDSITESTLVSPTPYLLDLMVAASLVSLTAWRRRSAAVPWSPPGVGASGGWAGRP